MRYISILGNTTSEERKKIVEIWNSPNNLLGQNINVMMISSVAYSGVSFFNTTNMLILNKISNISKWKQICGRIVRTSSHALLPKDMRIAKIYTMIIL